MYSHLCFLMFQAILNLGSVILTSSTLVPIMRFPAHLTGKLCCFCPFPFVLPLTLLQFLCPSLPIPTSYTFRCLLCSGINLPGFPICSAYFLPCFFICSFTQLFSCSSYKLTNLLLHLGQTHSYAYARILFIFICMLL